MSAKNVVIIKKRISFSFLVNFHQLVLKNINY